MREREREREDIYIEREDIYREREDRERGLLRARENKR
jgi:hypothetical protein